MRCLFSSLVLFVSCQVVAGGNAPATKGVYLIDFTNNVAVIPVAEMARSDNNHLVFIEVAAVENPRVLPLAFSVSFLQNDNKINLGSFALFPGNNPGNFIVPTQGRVDTTGKIQIELNELSEYEGTEAVRVEIRNVKLIDSLQ